MKPTIKIEYVDKKPGENHWSYPLNELDYIIEQIKDGTRTNEETFYYYDGRLYESYETANII